MSEPLARLGTRIRNVVGRLSPLALAVIGLLVASGVAGGGYYAYRTYDYVQHDNDFCMSCHLMSEPFERFARSAHQGLGCKACHRPNIVERSSMGITAVVEDPEEISVHAEVPNETCAECHIEGDPEKWRVIANTVGHQVHLQSDELEGLQCVRCHSTSIHEFAPIDRTCTQSGCHDDNTIQLGRMGGLTIHCAACHTFVAPPAAEPGILGDVRQAALLPDAEECLTCHVMRTLVEMPDPDPHQGGCAACHNPHDQTVPAEAAETCATAGCHDDFQAETPFHRGVDESIATNCLNCHQAHDFSLDGSNCAGCHEGAELAVADVGVMDFRHGRHPGIACGRCHSGGETHGAASTYVEDCRSCHHEAPVAEPCTKCHDSGDLPRASYRFDRTLTLTVGASSRVRTLTFPHEAHVTADCTACHTEGSGLRPSRDIDCQSCHEEHHRPETDCASCHVAAPVEAHPPSEAHVTCSGSGCHQDLPFEGLPRTRAFCLGCHQDLRDHEPNQRCADCHQLPPPRGAGALEVPER